MKEDNFDSCPVCKKETTNILLHINKSKKCKGKVTREQIEAMLCNAKSSKSNVSVATNKKHCRKKNFRVNVKILQDKIRENARKRKAKQRERKKEEKRKKYKIEWLKGNLPIERTERKKEFIHMSKWFLVYLSQGRIPPGWATNHFHLVEEKNEGKSLSRIKEEDPYAWTWLKHFDTALIEAVLSMKIIVLIPNSKWISAIKTLEKHEQNETLKEKLFVLIGKLQAGANANTMGIQLPEKYASNALINQRYSYKQAFQTDKFNREEEIMLTDLIAEVLGNEEGLLNKEFQDLLSISDDIENLLDALTYTTAKYDIIIEDID